MTNEAAKKSAFGWPFRILVALIFGLWLSILVPNLRPASATAAVNACVPNLKSINEAAQRWRLEYKKQPTDTYSLDDPTVLAFLERSELPACPGGGHYSPGANLADRPRCSIPGHSL